jgi:membrane protein required for colicin V production
VHDADPAAEDQRLALSQWGRESASRSKVSALDIFVITVLLGGSAVGFVRGFAYEVLSLLAWAAAIVMIRLFHAQLSSGLGAMVDTPPAAAVLAFALLFVPTFAFVKMLARSIGGRSRRSVLGPVDRALGGGFGLVKGLLAATLFFLFANLTTDLIYGAQAERPEWMTNSRTYPLLNASGRAIVDWVETRRHASEEAGE